MRPTPASGAAAPGDERQAPSWELVDRYLVGETTRDETTNIETWLREDGASTRAHMIERFRQLLNEKVAAEQPNEAMEQRIRAIVGADTPPPPEIHSTSVGRQSIKSKRYGRPDFVQKIGRSSLVLAMAAAVIVVFGLALQTRAPKYSSTTRSYATSTGQIATVTLDDGTRVTLAPRSVLRLDKFGARSRGVTLDGEAYFEVTASTGVPFVVHSGPATTRVLGTAFMVRHYANDANVHVTVTRGKVALLPRARPASALTLAAGYAGVATDSTVKGVSLDGDMESSWVNGKLVFRDIPLSDVLSTLSRWYGYEFRVTDSALSQQHVTLRLSTRSSAAALANLEQLLSVNLTVVGDTVTLVPHNPRSFPGQRRTKPYNVWAPRTEVGR